MLALHHAGALEKGDSLLSRLSKRVLVTKGRIATKKAPPPIKTTGLLTNSRRRRTLPPGGPGSTIRAVELNGRVRDGNGCSLYAIVTDKGENRG